MKARLTTMELDRVRRSCRMASQAFQEGSAALVDWY